MNQRRGGEARLEVALAQVILIELLTSCLLAFLCSTSMVVTPCHDGDT